MSKVGAVGIDFGSSRSVIAVAQKGGVEIITNEGSQRETPNVVGYGRQQRFIGEQGFVQMKSNSKNTIKFFNRFLAATKDTPHLAEESKWLTGPHSLSDDGLFQFNATYNNQATVMKPEQVTASMLGKIKQLVQRAEINNHDYVISVPNYFTEQERKCLLDACKLAEINVARLLNESAAIALGYGIFRLPDLKKENVTRNVVFIDMGHAKLSAFCASFTGTGSKLLAQAHERNLGSRNFDWTVLELYAKKFNEQYDLNPMKNPKAILRLLDGIEKQRKVLSANQEAGVNLEYLMEDCDLNELMNREQFEAIIAPFCQRFREVLQGLKAEIDNKKINIHSVEIIGGATRIPLLQKIIKEVFNTELSRTLNASECIARGCAMMSAILSPQFRVADYNIEEANYFPIKCSWQFKSKMEIEEKINTALLFDKGCSIPNIKSLTFNKDQGIDFKLFYDPVPAGVCPMLAQYDIPAQSPKEKEFSVKVRVKLDKNGIVGIEDITLTEDYFVEEQVKPAEKPADKKENQENSQPEGQDKQEKQENMEAEAKPEVKKKKKTRHTPVNFDNFDLYRLPEKKFQALFEVEANMMNQDKLVAETLERKNELESYIYDMRSKLAEKYHEFTTSDISGKLNEMINSDENWLYDEGLNANKSQYVNKIAALKKLSDPIEKRYRDFTDLPEIAAMCLENLRPYEAFVTSTEAKWEHISAEERKPVADEVNFVKEWIAGALNAATTAPKDKDLQTGCEDLKKRVTELFNKCNPIVNKAKPEPKKEEPKKEEAKPEEKMAEEPTEKKDEKMDIEN